MITTMPSRRTAKGPVQHSALPAVITRLNEIRRRLIRTRAHCRDNAQRNLIAAAELEVHRGLQLLEAELARAEPSSPSP